MILPPNINYLMLIVNLIIYYINNKSIYVSHLLETLAQNAGVEVVKKAALLAEGNAANRDDIVFLKKLPLFTKTDDGYKEIAS